MYGWKARARDFERVCEKTCEHCLNHVKTRRKQNKKEHSYNIRSYAKTQPLHMNKPKHLIPNAAEVIIVIAGHCN